MVPHSLLSYLVGVFGRRSHETRAVCLSVSQSICLPVYPYHSLEHPPEPSHTITPSHPLLTFLTLLHSPLSILYHPLPPSSNPPSPLILKPRSDPSLPRLTQSHQMTSATHTSLLPYSPTSSAPPPHLPPYPHFPPYTLTTPSIHSSIPPATPSGNSSRSIEGRDRHYL